jgi:nucleotide-binding universal stress UspA family protein
MSAMPIVAATDGSEESLRAVDWAAREAVLRGPAPPARAEGPVLTMLRPLGGHATGE